MSKSTTKRQETSQEHSRIPRWAGWDAYFCSRQGAKNIRSVVNGIAKKVNSREQACRFLNNLPEPPDPISNRAGPTTLAVEMISLNPDLAQFIPESVRKSVGDMDAAVALAKLCDQDGAPDRQAAIRRSVFVAIALMAHGITLSRHSYTSGSDQCDLSDTTMYGIAEDSESLPPEDIEAAESLLEPEEMDAICAQYNINSDFFFNFCPDTGGGDGTGYWTNEFVVRLMPGYREEILEGEFTDYECETCGRPDSICECLYPGLAASLLQGVNDIMKAEADGGGGDTGAQEEE